MRSSGSSLSSGPRVVLPCKRVPQERPGVAFKYTSVDRVDTGRDPNKTLFPPGRSLECFSEGADAGTEQIEFTHENHVNLAEIKKLALFDSLAPQPIVLYHDHVAWSYVMRYHRVRNDGYEFHMVSHGPHLSLNDDPLSIGKNESPRLAKPAILKAAFAFVDKDGQEKLRFDLDTEQLTVPKLFTLFQLAALADGGTLMLRTRFVIARKYFSLQKLLWKPPTVAKKMVECVAQLLRGEQLPGCDWTITVGSGAGDSTNNGRPLTYHVHSAAFARISDHFKKVFDTGASYKDDFVSIYVRGPKRCAVYALTAADMPILLAIAYGTPVPLPEDWMRTTTIGRALMFLLKWNVMTDFVFPHWELVVCKQALTINKRDLSSLNAVYELLLFIWACPYGALPVAKRVAISVFADMLYMPTPSGKVLDIFKHEGGRATKDLFICDLTDKIYSSTFTHIAGVTAVRRVGLAAPSQKKKKDEKPTTVLAASDEPTVLPHAVSKPEKNPEPEILMPKPEDAKPEPAIVIPELKYAKSEMVIVMPEPEDAKPEPEIVVPKQEDAKPESESVIQEPEDVKPEPENVIPKPEDAKSEPKTVESKPEDVKQEPEIVESKPETAESEDEEWHDEAVDNFNPRDIKCRCVIS